MQGNNGNAQKNYRLKFVKFIKEKNYVEFQIRLICLEDDRLNVEFFERYSNLREFHEIFKKESGSINFPKFPPKKYIGSTDDKFLSQRQTGLEVYFDAVLGSREFSGLPSLRKWVDNLIKKYNKGSKTSTSVIEPTRHVEQVVQHVAPRNGKINLIQTSRNGKKSLINIRKISSISVLTITLISTLMIVCKEKTITERC